MILSFSSKYHGGTNPGRTRLVMFCKETNLMNLGKGFLARDYSNHYKTFALCKLSIDGIRVVAALDDANYTEAVNRVFTQTLNQAGGRH